MNLLGDMNCPGCPTTYRTGHRCRGTFMTLVGGRDGHLGTNAALHSRVCSCTVEACTVRQTDLINTTRRVYS